MENFTPISATIGGILIGLAASVLLITHGRIAGISGILGGIHEPQRGDKNWRMFFLIGLIMGASFYVFPTEHIVEIKMNPFGLKEEAHYLLLVFGGLFVGLGSQVGSGCTSGHGVCGIGLLSLRSLVATITFMAAAVITVFILRIIIEG